MNFLTVDVLLFAENHGALELLLIERKFEPFAGHWALPGGFVEESEELSAAAHRELAEETGISNSRLWQFKTYGTLDRDPRGRTVSVTYIALGIRQNMSLRAGDDAAKAAFFDLKTLPKLAFDHQHIVDEALQFLRLQANEARRETSDFFNHLLPSEEPITKITIALNAIKI